MTEKQIKKELKKAEKAQAAAEKKQPDQLTAMQVLDRMWQTANQFKPEVTINIPAGIFSDLVAIVASHEAKLTGTQMPVVAPPPTEKKK